jgi:type IV secretion system protein VirD4
VQKASYSFSGKKQGWSQQNMTASVEHVERPLLTADEVGRLPAEASLVFATGARPIYGRKIRYWQDPEFARNAGIPPPQELVRIVAAEPDRVSALVPAGPEEWPV